jgi:hypothetical protein
MHLLHTKLKFWFMQRNFMNCMAIFRMSIPVICLLACPLNVNLASSETNTSRISKPAWKQLLKPMQCQHIASKSELKGYFAPVTLYCYDFKSFTNRCAEPFDTPFARVQQARRLSEKAMLTTFSSVITCFHIFFVSSN